MIVADLSRDELAERLRGAGLRLRIGPFVTSVRSSLPPVLDGIALHYQQHALEPDDGFADFHVRVAPPPGLRRFLRPQVFFYFEGRASFHPLPRSHAFPMFEWGLNWCFGNHCHQYLIVHAAVLARAGRAVLLPAPPGSGKSTLCAALTLSGWRLLSDELALIDPDTGRIWPLPRPISLKNQSIDVIRTFSGEAVLGTPVHETSKGTVAHMRPPVSSVRAASEPARAAAIVFPRYSLGAATTMTPISKARAFMRLVDNTFNYDIHGRRAFETLGDLVDGSLCREFEYSRLEQAVESFGRLGEQR